jgi:hypothetical protein
MLRSFGQTVEDSLIFGEWIHESMGECYEIDCSKHKMTEAAWCVLALLYAIGDDDDDNYDGNIRINNQDKQSFLEWVQKKTISQIGEGID